MFQGRVGPLDHKGKVTEGGEGRPREGKASWEPLQLLKNGGAGLDPGVV